MASCREVIEEVSNYLDGDTAEGLRLEIERHLAHCGNCSVLFDSVRKLLVISCDDRIFELPAGVSDRLHRFLNALDPR